MALSADSTRGAYYALVEFEKAGAIKLIGFDQDLLPPIRNGGLDSVVVQNSYVIGQLAVRQINGQLHGAKVADKILVQPELVTGDNIDSPNMRQIFTARWWAGQ